MEPTSEQELKQLLDEDKISQTEYEQLLEAMESKNPTGNRVNRPRLSRKKTKIAAILFTVQTALFLWLSLYLVNSQALRNKSLVIGAVIVSVIVFGIWALRYWVAYWTYKENHS